MSTKEVSKVYKLQFKERSKNNGVKATLKLLVRNVSNAATLCFSRDIRSNALKCLVLLL